METFAETLDNRIFSTIIILIIALITSWIGYKIGFFQISTADKNDHPIPLRYLMYAILLFFAGPLIAGSIPWSLWQSLGFVDKGWLPVIGVGLAALGLFGYVCLIPLWIKRSVLSNGKLITGFDGFKHFLFGVGTWFIAYPIVAFLGQILVLGLYFIFGIEEADQSPVKVLKSSFANPMLFYFLVGTIAIIVPIIEELLFRGFFQAWLKNFGGRAFAVILTSIIFSAFHFSFEQGLTNIEFISALFVLSCFLGFIYEKQNSLWASIGLHVMFNITSILFIFLTT